MLDIGDLYRLILWSAGNWTHRIIPSNTRAIASGARCPAYGAVEHASHWGSLSHSLFTRLILWSAGNWAYRIIPSNTRAMASGARCPGYGIGCCCTAGQDRISIALIIHSLDPRLRDLSCSGCGIGIGGRFSVAEETEFSGKNSVS